MSKKVKEVEVRCCCDVRLLGFLPFREDGIRMVVPEVSEVTMAIYDLPLVDLPIKDVKCINHFVNLPIDICYINAKAVYAYKSGDYPIEILRQIPGWRDPTSEELEADPVGRGDHGSK